MSDVGRALEAAIAENFDDLAAHAAYADLLTEQGDPRGEFIQVQLALEDPQRSPEERKQLRQREQELFGLHRRDWLGPIAPFVAGGDDPGEEEFERNVEVRFARGWVTGFVVRGELSMEAAEALAPWPAARCLRELRYEKEGGESRFRATAVLARSLHLGNVRLFRFGDEPEGEWEGDRNCYTYTSDHVLDLIERMPRLEELYLLAKGFDPGLLFSLSTLSNLRLLLMYHVEGYHPLDVLADNPAFANLTHLMLHPHGFPRQDRAYLDLAALRAVIRSPNLRSLTHLQLRLCSVGDEGCVEVVASGVLKRLKMLDLRHGCITDAGARTLAACPDLRNLEVLDVNRNGLTADGLALLRATGVQVVGDDQQTADELARDEYLNEGDFE